MDCRAGIPLSHRALPGGRPVRALLSRQAKWPDAYNYTLMKTKKELLEAITRLTFKIESQYPELYRFLDESPETIPAEAHPHMDIEALSTYWNGLRRMLLEYKKTHLQP